MAKYNFDDRSTLALNKLADELEDLIAEGTTDSDVEAELEAVKAVLMTRAYGSTPKKKGWTYKEQRAYKRNRFNNLEPIPCLVFNHKVEQVARAIAFGLAAQNTSTVGECLHNVEPSEPICIGALKGKGATLYPSANTRLAMLGLNGNAVLHWLGSMRVVDELTGQTGEVIVNDGVLIYTSVGVLINLAMDCVRSPSAILNNYKASKRIHG